MCINFQFGIKIICVMALTGYVCLDLEFGTTFEVLKYHVNLTDDMKFKIFTPGYFQTGNVLKN